jgi:hypothetical protein
MVGDRSRSCVRLATDTHVWTRMALRAQCEEAGPVDQDRPDLASAAAPQYRSEVA